MTGPTDRIGDEATGEAVGDDTATPSDDQASPPDANFTTGTDRPWLALATLLLASFMGILDIFIVNVAGPEIQTGLNASFGELQLIIAGYAIAYAVGLVTGGRLGDLFGQRQVFLLGTAFFGLTSAGCAVAPNPTAEIVLRVLQGLAAAVMLPQVLALIQLIFPPERRGTAIGLYGASIGLGAVLGQVIGGLLLGWNPLDLGWRVIFLVNVPLCALAIIGIRATVPRTPGKGSNSLDLVGAVLLGLALFMLLHPVIIAGESGWNTLATVEIVAAILLFVAFFSWERRMAGDDPNSAAPLLPPRLFAQSGFSKGLGTALFFYSGNAGFVLVLTYFLQRGEGLSPLASALVFAPMAAATMITSLTLTPLRERFGHRVVIVGAVMSIAGLLVVVPAVGVGSGLESLLLLQPGLLLYGLGGGLVAPSIVGLSLEQVQPSDVGAASGGLLTVTQASEAIGIAAIGALFGALFVAASPASAFTTSLLVVSVFFVVTASFIVSLRNRPAAASSA